MNLLEKIPGATIVYIYFKESKIRYVNMNTHIN